MDDGIGAAPKTGGASGLARGVGLGVTLVLVFSVAFCAGSGYGEWATTQRARLARRRVLDALEARAQAGDHEAYGALEALAAQEEDTDLSADALLRLRMLPMDDEPLFPPAPRPDRPRGDPPGRGSSRELAS